MPFLRNKIDWFGMIATGLLDAPEKIWSDGDIILCQTKNDANTLADLLECLYRAQGEEMIIATGHYDPAEDERNNETDKYTGWWYVDIS